MFNYQQIAKDTKEIGSLVYGGIKDFDDLKLVLDRFYILNGRDSVAVYFCKSKSLDNLKNRLKLKDSDNILDKPVEFHGCPCDYGIVYEGKQLYFAVYENAKKPIIVSGTDINPSHSIIML